MQKFLTKIMTALVGVITLVAISAWIGFVAGIIWGIATRCYDYAQYLLGLI